MKRKKKIQIISDTIKEHTFGTQMSEREYRWIAEHIVDALKEAKKSPSND